MTGQSDDVAIRSKKRANARAKEPTDSEVSRPSSGLASASHGGRRDPAERSSSNLRMSRELTLKTAAREYVWLYDYRHGVSLGEIATRDRVSIQRVEFGVGRARAQEKGKTRDGVTDVTSPAASGPRLVPLFPIGHYTPQSVCPHKEPIELGSSLCCMVCHESGIDHHPALKRDSRNEPSPEAARKPDPSPRDQKLEELRTRKQRRHRQFVIDLS